MTVLRRSPLFLLALLPLLAGAPGPSHAQRDRAAPAGIAVHYETRELAEIVAEIGRATGQRFIHGDELRGVVTITVPDRVSQAEALALLRAALNLRGFTAIAIEGGVWKIVPLLETASEAPVARGAGPGDLDPTSDRPLTTLLHLRHVPADAALVAMNEFAPTGGAVVAYAPTNSLILAGSEGQLRRLMTIARLIDDASGESLLAKSLRYRLADQMASLVDEVFNDMPIASQRAEIWTDERTNMIIVKAPSDLLAEIRRFVYEMDVPIEGGGLVRVVPIRNRDAEEVAEILRTLGEGRPTRPRVWPQGMPGQTVEAQADLGGALAGRDFSIVVDAPTRSLLVRTDPETFGVIAELISTLDLIPPRISVEVIVLEVQRPSAFALGIDFFTPVFEPTSRDDFVVFVNSNPTGGGIPQQPGPGSRLFARYARDPLLLTFTGPDGQTFTTPVPRDNGSFQAGEAEIETNVLLRPQLVVLSGEEHELFAGNNIPIPVSGGGPTTTAADGSTVQVPDSPVTTRQQIQRTDVGVRLRVKPTLGEQGVVNLDLELDVSDTRPPVAGSPEAVGPTLSHSQLATKIPLEPGQSAVIGALSQRGLTHVRTGTPWLMHIPVLGYLFSRVEKVWVDTELVAVVKARVMRTLDEDRAETIRRRLAFERASSRVSSLNDLGDAPYAVLLETLADRAKAEAIADAFAEDGFETRVTRWDLEGRDAFDVYLTELESFEQAGQLARQLSDAGWSPELTVVSRLNELAGD